jgi:hypothetical protein
LVTVDGKKMTKATYNQIENGDPFDDDDLTLCEGVEIIGYVNEKTKVLLFSDNGNLKKFDLSPIENYSRWKYSDPKKTSGNSMPFAKYFAFEKEWVSWFDHAKNHHLQQFRLASIEEVKRAGRVIKACEAFLQEIKGLQVFIAT